MTAITKMLKAFGVNIEQQHLDAIEKIIPQVPRLIEQGTTVINSAVQNFDARLKVLEEENKQLKDFLIAALETAALRNGMMEEKILEAINGIRNDRDNGSHRTGTANGTRKHGSNPRNPNSRG